MLRIPGMELLAFCLASVSGASTPVYGAFTNGLVYGYAKGRNLKWHEMWDSDIIKATARSIAYLHAHDRKNTIVKDQKGNVLSDNYYTGNFFDFVRRVMGMVFPTEMKDPDQNKLFQECIPTKETLLAEMAEIEEIFKADGIPVIHCHGDVHIANILYDPDKQTAHLVDYETSMDFFSPIDMGFVLMPKEAYVQFNLIEADTPGEPFVDMETVRSWARHYLYFCAEAKGFTQCTPSEKEIDDYVLLIKKFAIVRLFELMAVITPVIAMTDDLGFDALKCCIYLYNYYLKNKHILRQKHV